MALLKARQQATSSTPISTPSDLATFSPEVLSSACSLEATPVTATSTTTQTVTEGATSTTTQVAVTTVVSSTTSTTTGTTQTFTSVVTAAPSTTTVYTTTTSTTTITYASNAPTGLTPYYLQVQPDNNPGAGWGLSDPQTHMTDNYYVPNQREVYELNNAGQLYSVTKNAWYYGLNGATSGKLFWSTNQAQGNSTFTATPMNDALNRLQLFMHVSTTNTANRVFCVSTVASGDANAATGFHVNYLPPGSTPPASCALTYLYLYPINNG